MNYGEIKNYLKALVNRTDFTDALAAQFIGQAQVRIERRLRLTAMERFVEFTLTSDRFNVPPDFLQIVDIWSGSKELRRVDMSQLLQTPTGSGQPEVFLQTGKQIILRPTPPSDQVMLMRYYAAQPALSADGDRNLWSVSAVDALVYAAAELAGDYFEDERLARFAEKFNTAMIELEEQSYSDDFAGPMSVSPTYTYSQD